ILRVGDKELEDEDTGQDSAGDLEEGHLVPHGAGGGDPAKEGSDQAFLGEADYAAEKDEGERYDHREIDAGGPAALPDLIGHANNDGHGKKAVDLLERAEDRAVRVGHDGQDDDDQNAGDHASDGGVLHSRLLQDVSEKSALCRQFAAEIRGGKHGTDAAEVNLDGELGG